MTPRKIPAEPRLAIGHDEPLTTAELEIFTTETEQLRQELEQFFNQPRQETNGTLHHHAS